MSMKGGCPRASAAHDEAQLEYDAENDEPLRKHFAEAAASDCAMLLHLSYCGLTT